MMRSLLLVGPAFLCCCKESCGPLSPVELQDCASLSSESDWLILGGTPGVFEPLNAPLRLSAGQSRTGSLWPPIDDECAGSYAISWSTEDTSVASVLPRPDRSSIVWVTGISPGSTRVVAHLSFTDGVVQEVYRSVSVSLPEPPPPESIVVAQGELELDPENSALPPDPRSFIHFTTEAEGRLDAVVDWISPLNGVSPIVYESHCQSRVCGRIVLQFNVIGVKPKSDLSGILPSGDFTLRVTVSGSEFATWCVSRRADVPPDSEVSKKRSVRVSCDEARTLRASCRTYRRKLRGA